jgi:hypothetical protein
MKKEKHIFPVGREWQTEITSTDRIILREIFILYVLFNSCYQNLILVTKTKQNNKTVWNSDSKNIYQINELGLWFYMLCGH